jgi:hypothetical protein
MHDAETAKNIETSLHVFVDGLERRMQAISRGVGLQELAGRRVKEQSFRPVANEILK